MMESMDLEVRHLQALVAVAETGTFGKAAEALGFTQSAVSQQIAGLERALGTPVFDRPGGARAVRLTPAGEVMLDHARSLLAAMRGAVADVDAISSGTRGRLRVGTIQSAGTQVLPSLLTRFAVERPGVEIVLHEAHNPQDLLDMVEAQELDITFCDGADPDGPFTTRVVLQDPFVLLAPATSKWLGRTSVSIEEIAEEPLVGSRNPTCTALTVLSFGDLTPNFVFRSDDNSTIQGCVAAGLGVSLAPLLTIDLHDPTTTIVPVNPPVPPRLLTLTWHAGRRRSPLLDAFIEATLAVCAEIEAGWASELAA
jgi:DNA-binding transcriptional LysR family regulator